jgi:hypothetical protein
MIKPMLAAGRGPRLDEADAALDVVGVPAGVNQPGDVGVAGVVEAWCLV